MLCWNEELGEGDSESGSDALDDVNADVAFGAFDSGNCLSRDACSLRKVVLGESGFCPSNDDIRF